MASENLAVGENNVNDVAAGRKAEVMEIVNELIDPNAKPEKVIQMYATWAETYDTDCALVYAPGNHGPAIAAELVVNSVKDKEARILDFAAGTGFVGQMLLKNGYTNIDALDASAPMLKQAKQKNIYRNYICAFLGNNRLLIETDTYDAAVTSGSFMPGHVNHQCFAELIRIVKPGGYICINTAEDLMTTSPFFEGFEAAIKKYKENGCWEIVERSQGPHYFLNHRSYVFRFKVLDTKTHLQ